MPNEMSLRLVLAKVCPACAVYATCVCARAHVHVHIVCVYCVRRVHVHMCVRVCTACALCVCGVCVCVCSVRMCGVCACTFVQCACAHARALRCPSLSGSGLRGSVLVRLPPPRPRGVAGGVCRRVRAGSLGVAGGHPPLPPGMKRF